MLARVIAPPRNMLPMTTSWLCTGLPSAAKHYETGQCQCLGRPGRLWFDHVQVDVALSRMDRCAYAPGIGLEVVEGDTPSDAQYRLRGAQLAGRDKS